MVFSRVSEPKTVSTGLFKPCSLAGNKRIDDRLKWGTPGASLAQRCMLLPRIYDHRGRLTLTCVQPKISICIPGSCQPLICHLRPSVPRNQKSLSTFDQMICERHEDCPTVTLLQ